MPPRRSEMDAIKEWFEYNTFVRKRYLKLISGLPNATLTKDRGASYPSILDVQTHLLDVLKSWLHACETGEDSPELNGFTLDEVAALEEEVDEYVTRFVANLKPASLEEFFTFTPFGSKRTRRVRGRHALASS